MKKGYLVLAGVLASVLVSTSAMATVTQDTDLGTLTSSFGTQNVTPLPVLGGFNTGAIAPGETVQVDFTFSSLVLPTYLEVDYGNTTAYGNGVLASYTSSGFSSSPFGSGIVKVLASGGFGTTGGDHGILYLMNRTGNPIDFKASFFGLSTVTSEVIKVAAVPLPKTLSMFGAVLLGMFGVSRLRKKNATVSL